MYILWILVLPVPSEWFQKTISEVVSYVSSRLYPMFHWVHGTWRNNNPAACDCSSLGRECWFLRQDIDQMMKVQKQPLARFYGTYLLIKRCNPMTRVGWRPPQQFQGLILRLWWIYSNVFCNFLTWSFSEHVVTWKKNMLCLTELQNTSEPLEGLPKTEEHQQLLLDSFGRDVVAFFQWLNRIGCFDMFWYVLTICL